MLTVSRCRSGHCQLDSGHHLLHRKASHGTPVLVGKWAALKLFPLDLPDHLTS